MKEVYEEARRAIENERYDRAIETLCPLARAGLAEAQFLLGYLYFTSADVSKSDSRGWLERAAAQDHPEALYYLACMGDVFDFGPPEDERHGQLLIRSAELGCPAAQRDLGCLYSTGDGPFPQDEAAGRFWYHRAAEQGMRMHNTITGLCSFTVKGASRTELLDLSGFAVLLISTIQERYTSSKTLQMRAPDLSGLPNHWSIPSALQIIVISHFAGSL